MKKNNAIIAIVCAVLVFALLLVSAACAIVITWEPTDSLDKVANAIRPPVETPVPEWMMHRAEIEQLRVEISGEGPEQSAADIETNPKEDFPQAVVPADDEQAEENGGEPEEKQWTEEDAAMLAKTVWGEARGCSTVQRAAVVWCILNRVDSARFSGSISGVITAPGQFHGYSPSNPVDDEILALVVDVLERWSIESTAVGDVGRVLPRDYLYFSGNGVENKYSTEYGYGSFWDWSAWNPYEK